MSEAMTLCEAPVGSQHLVDFYAVRDEVSKITGISMTEMQDSSRQMRELMQGGAWSAGWISRDRMRVKMWADVVVNKGASFDDIYVKPQTLMASESDLLLIGKTVMATYHLLGIPREDWQGWHRQSNLSRTRLPHIYRYIQIAEEAGIRIGPQDARDLHLSMVTGRHYPGTLTPWEQEMRSAPSPAVFQRYVRFLRRIENLGIQRQDIIGNPAEWWWADWSPEAVVRFTERGIAFHSVKVLEDMGITGSALIIKVLRDGMPEEWAVEASKARATAES